MDDIPRVLSFLTSRAPPLEMNGRVYVSCIRSTSEELRWLVGLVPITNQGSHRSGKSQGKFYFLKVREKSVNFEFDIKSGKIVLMKDRKSFIEHPILYSEVFIYIHTTAYCLHKFLKYNLYQT